MQRPLSLLPLALLILSLPIPSCKKGGRDGVVKVQLKEVKEKAIVLGFDGVDPDLLTAWAEEGYLPEIKELLDSPFWDFQRLLSTNPPQSPVAWSTFATGLNPGGHGIYDFVKRDPSTYLPDVGTSSLSDPEFNDTGKVIRGPSAENFRKGTPFWTIAARGGIRTSALNIPYSFPPDELPNGHFLSGLGIPDIRGTNSTFYYFANDLSEEEIKAGAGGARFFDLEKVKEGTWKSYIEGPKEADGRARVSIPFTVKMGGDSLSIKVQEKEETVKSGSLSDWFELEFTVTPFFRVHSMVRFIPIISGPGIHIYMYPLSFHPESPFIPFTNPPEFSTELFKKHGFFKTVGWVYDTSALNSEKITEDIFLMDLKEIRKKKTEYILSHLAGAKPNLFIAVWTFTDRISHMFYRLMDEKHPLYDRELALRHGDAIRNSYEEMDKIVGRVKEMVDGDTLLIIVSDHGFHSFRRGLNLNTFLLKEGFLSLEGGQEWSEKDFLLDVDWKKTKAYALGTGQIYINMKGREGRGTVAYGREYEEVVQEICRRLEELVDPVTGEKPVSNAFPKEEIFSGKNTEKAPDIQLAFREGYRTSWETALGGVPRNLFSDNKKKWSGDHAASDAADTEGILIVNRKVEAKRPWIGDIGPTILRYFRMEPPADMDGTDLFQK